MDRLVEKERGIERVTLFLTFEREALDVGDDGQAVRHGQRLVAPTLLGAHVG